LLGGKEVDEGEGRVTHPIPTWLKYCKPYNILYA